MIYWPNTLKIDKSWEQDPIQMLVYLPASLPPSEGNHVLLHSGQRARWTNLVWSMKTNLHPDTYVGFIYTRTVNSSCGPPEHQGGLCVKLEIRDLGIKGRLGLPSCWAHWADVAFTFQNQIHSTVHISFVLESMWALQGPIFVESLCRVDECLKWFPSLKQPQKHSTASPSISFSCSPPHTILLENNPSFVLAWLFWAQHCK